MRYHRHHHYKPYRQRRMHIGFTTLILWVVPLAVIGVIVASFAGVQPLASYKDKVVAAVSGPFVINEDEARVIENEVFLLVNKARQDNGLAPLLRDSSMDTLARQHSEYMKNTDSINHNGFEVRASQLGGYVGENCADGYGAEGLVRSWLASPGHKANIMDPGFIRTGIGLVSDGANTYCTQIFSD